MLESVKTRFLQLADRLTPAPSRDALVQERDQLLASPPPRPDSNLSPEPEAICPCPHCAEVAGAERAKRATYASWSARLDTITSLLRRKTTGGVEERDEAGAALLDLRDELVRAQDTNRARQWERRIEFDARGREIRAWDTAPALAAVSQELLALYRQAEDQLPYLSTHELTEAIAEARRRMQAALARELKEFIAPEQARRAGLTTPPPSEPEMHGLHPGGRSDPSILGGTVRFSRRDRA
jgi:hypothetical protein